MKNISLLLILSLLLPNLAFAETVYLNDGTVLIGETQSTSESFIVVKTSKGNIPVLKSSIAKIDYQAADPTKTIDPIPEQAGGVTTSGVLTAIAIGVVVGALISAANKEPPASTTPTSQGTINLNR